MIYFSLLLVAAGVSLWMAIQPTNKANWSIDQKILPYARIQANKITIYNIRNFKYRTETDYSPGYYNKTFDLNEIRTMDYVMSPFSKYKGVAHTFLTFGFNDGSYVSISIEIRKKVGQFYSPFKSLFRVYEHMYVIADEKDVIKLRTNYRRHRVYLFPMNMGVERIRKIFLSMINRANELRERPEFYELFTNACTTNIIKHLNEVVPKRIPLSYKVILSGYSDRLVYDLGLIDTDLPFEEAQKKFLINDRAMKYADDPDFSKKIRLSHI